MNSAIMSLEFAPFLAFAYVANLNLWTLDQCDSVVIAIDRGSN